MGSSGQRRIVHRVLLATVAALVILRVLGRLFRAELPVLAAVDHIPLMFAGPLLVAELFFIRGRARWVMGGFGLSLSIWGLSEGAGWRDWGEAEVSGEAIVVSHISPRWGRYNEGPYRWAEQMTTIAKTQSDIIVLSEAPPEDLLQQLIDHGGWQLSAVQNRFDRTDYWYHMVVLSRRPIAPPTI